MSPALPSRPRENKADKTGAISGRRLMENGTVVNLAEWEAMSYGLYGGVVTSTRQPVIELNAALPLSILRDDIYENGATVTDPGSGSYDLRHSTGGDEGHLLSARRGRYEPGAGALAGVGVYLSGGLSDASAKAEWGYFDTADPNSVEVRDGLVWGYDVDGLYWRVVKGGTETLRRYQKDWKLRNYLDINPFDGKARIFQCHFAYYGAGPVIWQISEPMDGQMMNVLQIVDAWAPEQGLSLNNPNLKLGALVDSTGGSDDFTVHLLGRQFQIDGKHDPVKRVTSATRIGFATDDTQTLPVLSFRRKPGNRPVTVGPAAFSALVRQNRVRVQVRVNSDLTDPVWETIPETPESETSLEYDVSASAVDLATGVKLWEGMLPSGAGAGSVAGALSDLVTEVPDGAVVTYAVQAVGGTGSMDLTARMNEEF